jgi:hypothetical protein
VPRDMLSGACTAAIRTSRATAVSVRCSGWERPGLPWRSRELERDGMRQGPSSFFFKNSGSSRIWWQMFVTLCKGEMTHDAVEWCQGTSAGGGCSTRVWTRWQRQRDGSAAGGHPRFWGRYLSRHPRPTPAPTACRKRTRAGPHEAPMRDLAKPGPARRPGAFARGLARGDSSRDRASGEAEWWVAGC